MGYKNHLEMIITWATRITYTFSSHGLQESLRHFHHMDYKNHLDIFITWATRIT